MKNSKSDKSNTGYKGISQRTTGTQAGKFEVVVRLPNMKKQQVGRYQTLEEAITARINFIKNLL